MFYVTFTVNCTHWLQIIIDRLLLRYDLIMFNVTFPVNCTHWLSLYNFLLSFASVKHICNIKIQQKTRKPYDLFRKSPEKIIRTSKTSVFRQLRVQQNLGITLWDFVAYLFVGNVHGKKFENFCSFFQHFYANF